MRTNAGADEALKFPVSVGDTGPPDYGKVVADQLKALRQRAGLTSEAMAGALSKELGRSVGLPSVSRWENGHLTPGSDVLIAAMRVAGLPFPAEGPRDPRRALEFELESLRRQVDLISRRMNHHDELPILPEGARKDGHYMTVAVAAKRIGRSRETLYDWIRSNRLRAYRWMGRTVVRPEDLDLASQP